MKRRENKSRFQQKLDELTQQHRDSQSRVSQTGASQSAQPPDLHGKYKWKDVHEELPPYYAPIHIYDGKTIHHNWSRVWSETQGNIYVNNEDNRVITKATHWSPPDGLDYPKYQPLTSDDIKLYTRRDIKHLIENLNKLSDIYADRLDDEYATGYVQGVEESIIILEQALKNPKRMTGG